MLVSGESVGCGDCIGCGDYWMWKLFVCGVSFIDEMVGFENCIGCEDCYGDCLYGYYYF